MNCFNHVNDPSVAQCLDCGKGLCKSCTLQFSIPICSSCNTKRASKEKWDISWSLIKMVVSGLILSYVMAHFAYAKSAPSTPVPLFGFLVVIWFLIGAGLPEAWKRLSNFGAGTAMSIPLYLIFLVVKLWAACFMAVFLGPYKIVRNVVRLVEISRL